MHLWCGYYGLFYATSSISIGWMEDLPFNGMHSVVNTDTVYARNIVNICNSGSVYSVSGLCLWKWEGCIAFNFIGILKPQLLLVNKSMHIPNFMSQPCWEVQEVTQCDFSPCAIKWTVSCYYMRYKRHLEYGHTHLMDLGLLYDTSFISVNNNNLD